MANIIRLAEGAKPVETIDLSDFSVENTINLALQRTQALNIVPRAGVLVRKYNSGDKAPLENLVKERQVDILIRALALAYIDAQMLIPWLEDKPPKSIIDIGAGYGLTTFYLAKHFNAKVVLIDETVPTRNNRQNIDAKTVRAFYKHNGFTTRNMAFKSFSASDLSKVKPVELVVSFLRVGYNTPFSEFSEFIQLRTKSGDKVIFDTRPQTRDETNSMIQDLGEIIDTTPISGGKLTRNLLLRR